MKLGGGVFALFIASNFLFGRDFPSWEKGGNRISRQLVERDRKTNWKLIANKKSEFHTQIDSDWMESCKKA